MTQSYGSGYGLATQIPTEYEANGPPPPQNGGIPLDAGRENETMFDPRVNVILDENPGIIERYESGELDKTQATLEVLSRIRNHPEMESASQGMVNAIIKQALEDESYRKRGIIEPGEVVGVRAAVNTVDEGYELTLTDTEDTLGPVEESKIVVKDTNLGTSPTDFSNVTIAYLKGEIKQRVGPHYEVELYGVGEVVGPLSTGSFLDAW